ncbi:MAG: hypothetical protein J2P15_09175 [Micromonosporaceae bacterium]|nr:hypothetical protein [Micromonosporaceae bacterium]
MAIPLVIAGAGRADPTRATAGPPATSRRHHHIPALQAAGALPREFNPAGNLQPAQTCLGAVMSRYAAPVAFTLASLWVAVLYVLLSK